MMSKGCGKVVETFGIQDTYQIRQAGVKKSKDILLYTYGNRRIRILMKEISCCILDQNFWWVVHYLELR